MHVVENMSVDMMDDMQSRKDALFCWGSTAYCGRLNPLWTCKEEYQLI